MKCRQPGCPGTIVDGYCDVCGMPPVTGAAGRPAARPVSTPAPGVGRLVPRPVPAPGPSRPAAFPTRSAGSGRPTAGTGEPCRQPGCIGHIVDGYCDVCGTPASAPVTPEPGSAETRASDALGSTALGSARAVSFGERTVPKRTGTVRARSARIGAGLTVVPPAPLVDPEKAIMVNPQVPKEKRSCSHCGTPVGRSESAPGGREEGFCPKCGAPYSFTPKLSPGDLVAGQYEMVGALAHGGMGWIYLARDRNVSNRWVVLKGLLNAGDTDTARAAIAEQQFLAQVEHPLIVEIYNFVTHNGAGYIVMEYVGGRSLKQLLKQRKEANGGQPDPLPVDQSLAFLIEILPALSYLHELGLVYCDFKPDNVIQVGDALKLIDLGGVRRVTDDESAIYATVGFQAPEVAKLGASVASDIFTVGRTLMVLCADVPQYTTTYEFSTPPAESMPAFRDHDSLYRLLLKACAPDPADRFASAEELRVQMLGILREVVGVASGRRATTSAASALFEPPTIAGDRVNWRALPALHPDPADRMYDWLASVDVVDPVQRLGLLNQAPTATTEVMLAKCLAALEAGNQKLLLELTHQLLTADPWEWRAVWMTGLGALVSGDFKNAQASFNAVYGQIPGELAPKLALALACEYGGEEVLAEKLYTICAATDANYVTPAGFGLARIRAKRGDLPGALGALDLVPITSRGYTEAQRLKAERLITLGTSVDDLTAALKVVTAARLDPYSQAAFEVKAYEKALGMFSGGLIKLGGASVTRKGLRDLLESSYRELARATNDQAAKAELIDRANDTRPWSLL